MSDPIIIQDITRSEVIEGLRAAYEGMLANEKRKQPDTVGFPDMVAVIDHVERDGLPPRDIDIDEATELSAIACLPEQCQSAFRSTMYQRRQLMAAYAKMDRDYRELYEKTKVLIAERDHLRDVLVQYIGIEADGNGMEADEYLHSECHRLGITATPNDEGESHG